MVTIHRTRALNTQNMLCTLNARVLCVLLYEDTYTYLANVVDGKYQGTLSITMVGLSHSLRYHYTRVSYLGAKSALSDQ